MSVLGVLGRTNIRPCFHGDYRTSNIQISVGTSDFMCQTVGNGIRIVLIMLEIEYYLNFRKYHKAIVFAVLIRIS